MKTWEAKMPKVPKIKDRKRCFVVWRDTCKHPSKSRYLQQGGSVVWLTNKQITFHTLKDPTMILDEVTEKDTVEEFKKYMDRTID